MQVDTKYDGLGRRYFSHAPLRSYHFGLSTLLLLIVIFEAVYYSIRFAPRLGVEALASMIFPVVVAAVLWVRVLMAHQDAYRIYDSSQNPHGVKEDSGTEKLLNSLAYLLYAGFGLAMFALGSLYVAAAKAITEAAGR